MARTKRRAANKAPPKSPLKALEEEGEREEREKSSGNGQEIPESHPDGQGSTENDAQDVECEGQAGFDPSQDPANRPVETPGETAEDPGEYIGWWTMEKEDNLIDLYQKAEHLWNKKAPGFKLRNKKDLALTKWTKELGIPSKYLRKKIIHCFSHCPSLLSVDNRTDVF